MISKARIKWIKSLEIRKFRVLHNAFVAEGPKLVGELIACSAPLYLAATKEWLAVNRQLLTDVDEVDEVTPEELQRASLLKTPQSVLAVMPIPDHGFQASMLDSGLHLALDGVQDPGNLGTILRIADWFGIQWVLAQEGSADVYNPKCVQACMGALARVRVHYCELQEVIREAKVPVYGTFLDGNNIYNVELSPDGIIVMGNEGNGISKKIAELVSDKLCVPNYPAGSSTTESLNVAVATGIVCAEFRRRIYSSSSSLPPTSSMDSPSSSMSFTSASGVRLLK